MGKKTSKLDNSAMRDLVKIEAANWMWLHFQEDYDIFLSNYILVFYIGHYKRIFITNKSLFKKTTK
jgi:hypothetical protein